MEEIQFDERNVNVLLQTIANNNSLLNIEAQQEDKTKLKQNQAMMKELQKCIHLLQQNAQDPDKQQTFYKIIKFLVKNNYDQQLISKLKVVKVQNFIQENRQQETQQDQNTEEDLKQNQYTQALEERQKQEDLKSLLNTEIQQQYLAQPQQIQQQVDQNSLTIQKQNSNNLLTQMPQSVVQQQQFVPQQQYPQPQTNNLHNQQQVADQDSIFQQDEPEQQVALPIPIQNQQQNYDHTQIEQKEVVKIATQPPIQQFSNQPVQQVNQQNSLETLALQSPTITHIQDNIQQAVHQNQQVIQNTSNQSQNVQFKQFVNQIDKLTQQNLILLKTQSDYQQNINNQSQIIQDLQNQLNIANQKLSMLEAENQTAREQVTLRKQTQNQFFNIQDEIHTKLQQITHARNQQNNKLQQDQIVNQIVVRALELKQELVQQVNSSQNQRVVQKFDEKVQLYEQLLNNFQQSNKQIGNIERALKVQTQQKDMENVQFNANLNISDLKQAKQLLPTQLKSKQQPIDILQMELVKLLTKFGVKAPQMQRVDRNRWCVERTGSVLTLELNQRGVIIVTDDGGQLINKTPLSIYLKSLVMGHNSVGRMSGSKSRSNSVTNK